MIATRGKRERRRQEDEETTTTEGVATTSVCVCLCHRMCDSHQYYKEEEDRLTTTGDTTGQREGTTTTTMTRMTAMTTIMQDRLQARSDEKIRTSLDIIRLLTDGLRSILLAFFHKKPFYAIPPFVIPPFCVSPRSIIVLPPPPALAEIIFSQCLSILPFSFWKVWSALTGI